MKMAISIPDDVGTAAKRLGLSRSEFFALAAKRMMRGKKQNRLTAKINAAIKGVDTKTEKGLARMQFAVLADERW